MKPLDVKTGKDWRKWLEENHSTEKEVWLVFYKKNTGKQIISYEDALDDALCFGWIDGKLKSIDSKRYMIRFTPRRKNSQWSSGNVERYKRLLKKGFVTDGGKKSFEEKGFVYTTKRK